MKDEPRYTMIKEHNPLMSAREASKYVGYSVGTLQNLRSQNKGPKYMKPSGKIFYLKSELDAWMRGDRE